MDIESIAAFLGGSLGTLLIKSGIEHFTRKVDHNRLLEKFTYEKKILVAELAIAFYSHYRYNVQQMKSGLATIRETASQITPEGDFPEVDLSLLQLHMTNVGNTITEMFSTKYQEILSINLYFNFSRATSFKADNLFNLNSCLAKTKSIDMDIEFWSNAAFEEHGKGNENLSETYNKKWIALIPSYCTSLDTIISLLETDLEGADEIIKIIKEQLKLY